MKEIKEDLNEGRYTLCLWTGRLNMVEIPINSSQIEIILKLIWKFKGTRITKTVLKKKDRVGGISPHDFKTLYSYSNQDCGTGRG